MDQLQEKYEEALKDLTSYKNIYIDDMKEVFEQTQNFENKRLGYFKDILIGLHERLDLTKITEYVSLSVSLSVCLSVSICLCLSLFV